MHKFNVKNLTNRKYYLKWSFIPTFRRQKQLDNGSMMLEKDKCRLNKPTHIRLGILELSKELMKDCHYNYSINKYAKTELLFTDTNRVIYEIETKNIYEDLYKDNLISANIQKNQNIMVRQITQLFVKLKVDSRVR